MLVLYLCTAAISCTTPPIISTAIAINRSSDAAAWLVFAAFLVHPKKGV